MAADVRLAFREALITYLRATAPVTALVPTTSIYGERIPSLRGRPYIALAKLSMDPFEAQGLSGGTIEFTLHVFAVGESSDVIFAINKAVIAALQDAQLELDDGWCLDVSFVRSVPLTDTGETTEWHEAITFAALTGVEN